MQSNFIHRDGGALVNKCHLGHMHRDRKRIYFIGLVFCPGLGISFI